MKVLLTGATGYVGSVIAEKLQHAGHHVVALARSTGSADTLKSRNIEAIHGDLDSSDSLTDAAQSVDAIIHAAFKFEGDFVASLKTEKNAVKTFIAALQGTGKPLIYTSGTGVLGDTGDIVFDEETPTPVLDPVMTAEGGGALMRRVEVEQEVLTAKDVHGIVVRPPTIYGRGDGRTLLNILRMAAQHLGAVPYRAGTADHKWTYSHVDDVADLIALVLDKAGPRELFHAGVQSGLRTKAIAKALSTGMGLGGKTVELDREALGKAMGAPGLPDYWAMNSQSSGEKARRVLGWVPNHPDVLADLASAHR